MTDTHTAAAIDEYLSGYRCIRGPAKASRSGDQLQFQADQSTGDHFSCRNAAVPVGSNSDGLGKPRPNHQDNHQSREQYLAQWLRPICLGSWLAFGIVVLVIIARVVG